MKEQTLNDCRALFELAFGEGDGRFGDMLFSTYAEDCLRVIEEDGKLKSMLFSIPYDLQTESSRVSARYIYAVATAPEARGKGYAGELLRREISRGIPLFLRPSSPSLFGFYEKIGFSPFSPVLEQSGSAYGGKSAEKSEKCLVAELRPAEYMRERRRFLKAPYTEPEERFLTVHRSYGSAVGDGVRYAALCERHGDTVFFKEWLGDTALAPLVAAQLGAQSYRLRTYGEGGTPFGVTVGCPTDTSFLIAMD